AVGQLADRVEQPAVAVADPQALAVAAGVVEQPRAQLPGLGVHADRLRPRRDDLAALLDAEPAPNERLVLVPLEAQVDFAVLDLGRPLADQPVQLVELVLAGPPLAGDGDLPAVAGADVQDAVARGRRQLGPRIFHADDAVLDGRVRRREADALNL